MTSRLLTISAVAMGVALSVAPAAAQPNGWLTAPASYAGDDYRTPYASAQREAYDNGYRDGLKRGEEAARARRAFNIEIERDYRGAERGYNRNYGDRNQYRDTYRGGFAQGYRDGYGRYGAAANGRRNDGPWRNGNGAGYGRGWRNGDAGYGAFQNGISDGYDKALDDLKDRRRADVTRHKWYRSGDHDYDGKYGLSKDAYRVQYRRGFEEGYNRAYRDARRF
jgi:hypothetical protein